MQRALLIVKYLVFSLLAVCFLYACHSNTSRDFSNDYTIDVNLQNYNPKIDPAKYQHLRGKKFCMSNIRNSARNTSNFSFYSKDSKIRYQLSSLPNYGSPQLLQSYFWYAYQKAFLQAGLNAGADCREEDIPELWIILQSFNDEELQFKITLLKNRETAYEKDLVVTPAPASSRNHTALQKHAYDITDLTVVKILDDPGFQDVMLKYGK